MQDQKEFHRTHTFKIKKQILGKNIISFKLETVGKILKQGSNTNYQEILLFLDAKVINMEIYDTEKILRRIT